jgi:hypothetical protein
LIIKNRAAAAPDAVFVTRSVPSWAALDADLIRDVVAASDLTIRAGTARARYELDVRLRQFSAIADILNPARADPPAGKAAQLAWSIIVRGVKAVERGLSDLASGHGCGIGLAESASELTCSSCCTGSYSRASGCCGREDLTSAVGFSRMMPC